MPMVKSVIFWLLLGIKVGDKIMSGEQAEIKIGNALPLKAIPLGYDGAQCRTNAGRGGQLGRTAGTQIQVLAKEGKFALCVCLQAKCVWCT